MNPSYKKTRLSILVMIVLGALVGAGMFGITASSAFALDDDVTIGDMLEDHGAYISHAQIIEIVDGTGPWDADSTPGNDASPSNKIVRTFDLVKYDLEYSVTPFDDAEYDYYRNAYIGFKAVLPYENEDQATFDLDSMGWIDTEAGYEPQVTIETIGGKRCQVLTCYRKLIGTDTIPLVVPGTASVSFAIKVKGLPNGEQLKPEFYTFTAGSTATDNQTDYGNQMGYKTTPDIVTVSALPRYNVRMRYSSEVCQSGTFDFSSGNDSAINKDKGNVQGRYYCYGMILQLYNTSAAKGLKGIELPTGDITFDVDIKSLLTYIPADASTSTNVDVSNTYTPLVWVGEGESNTSTKANGRKVNIFGNNQNPIGGGASVYNVTKSGQAWWRSAYKGGTWDITQDGTTLHVKVSDYVVDPDLFPYTTTNGAEGTHTFYDPAVGIQNVGCFSCGTLWMVQPFKNQNTGTHAFDEYNCVDATFSVTLRDYNLQATGLSGASVAAAPTDSSNQTVTSDDAPTGTYEIHAPGSYIHMVAYTYPDNTTCAMSGTDRLSYPYNFSDGTDSATIGSPIRILFGSRHSPMDVDNASVAAIAFLKFDDKALVYDPTQPFAVFHRGQTVSDYQDKVKYYFVAKQDRSGWNDDNEMKAALLTDSQFIFFENYEDLVAAHYTCVGIVAEDLYCYDDERMLFADNYYTAPFTVINDPSYIGYVAMFTQDSYLWRRHQVENDAARALGKLPGTLERTDYQEYIDDNFPRIGSTHSLPTYPWVQEIHSNTGLAYNKSVYDAEGFVSGGNGGYHYGDSLYIIGELAKVTKSVAQKSGNSPKKIYDIDYQQRYADYVLSPSVEDSLGNVSSARTTVVIKDTLPVGQSYIPDSAIYGGTYTERTPNRGLVTGGEAITPDVTRNGDGTTTLTFTFANVQPSSLKSIYYSVLLGDPGEPSNDVVNNQSLTNTVTITSTYDHRKQQEDYGNLATYSIMISKLRQQSLSITAVPLYNEQNDILTFYSSIGNYGSNDLANAIGINLMPHDDDSIGSDYNGTYTIQSMTLDKTRAGDLSDVRIYFTNDPNYRTKESSEYTRAEILTWTQGGVDADTGAITIPSGLGEIVAWAVLDDSLASEHSLRMESKLAPSGNKSGDTYAMSITDIDNTVSSAVYVVTREISGVAWRDMDYDDGRGEDDQLLSNVIVELIDGSGTVVQNLDGTACRQTTGTDGAYLFEKVPSGDYSLRFKPASGNWNGFEAVAKDSPRAGDTADSDADPVMTSGNLSALTISNIHMPSISEMASNKFLLRYMDAGIKELGSDVTLVKADFKNQSTTIPGAAFTVTGTSNLGTAVSIQATCKNNGDLELGHIPYGTYTITETTIPRGYLEPTSTWTLTVSASGIQLTSSAGLASGLKLLNIKGEAALAIEKTVDKDRAAVGEVITYTIKVTNTGNCILAPVTVTDAKLGMSDVRVASSLAPGEHTSIQRTYTLTEDDARAGSVVNTASAHGTPPDGITPPPDPSDDATTTVTYTPSIKIEKDVSPARIENVQVGATITWSFKVTNTGNVTLDNVNVTDELLSGKNISITLNKTTLAPNESTTATATTTATQSEIDAGRLTNVAVAHGKETIRNTTVDSQPDDATVEFERKASLLVAKKATEDSVTINDTIHYTITVTNTSNVTLTNVVISDPLLNESSTKVADSLAPGKSVSVQRTYSPVTEADAIAKKVVNVVTANGTPPNGVTPPNPSESRVTTPVTANPALTIDKTVTPTHINNAAVGNEVTWNFTVKNTGDITLSNVNVTDDYLSGLGKTVTLNKQTLAPNETATGTVTSTISQAEIDAGKVDNTAIAHGKEPVNNSMVNSAPDDASVTLDRNAALSVRKTVDKATARVGDTLTYTIAVVNTGNVTLTNVTITDPLLNITAERVAASLAPGKTITVTKTYTPVKESDAINKNVHNVVTAHGVPPVGVAAPTDPRAEADTAIESHPALAIEKSVSPTHIENAKAGNEVTWSFTIRNTGDVSVTNLALVDAWLDSKGVQNVSLSKSRISPNETATATVSTALTQAEIDSGRIDNTAHAVGKDIVDSNTVTSNDDDAFVTMDRKADLTISKSVDKETAHVGDILEYTIEITNTGNVTLAPVTLDDPLLEIETRTVSESLAPGQSVTVTEKYDCVTEDDAVAEKVVNIASAHGVPPASVDAPEDPQAQVETVIESAPSVKLVKTVDKQNIDPATTGDEVTWSFDVENTGDVTLKDISITDDLLDTLGIKIDIPEDTTIAPGETKTFSATQAITQQDIDAGVIDNEASVSACSVTSVDVEDGPATASVHLGQTPGIALEKNVDISYIPQAKGGEKVVFEMKVTNTGNVTLKDLEIIDDMNGLEDLHTDWFTKVSAGGTSSSGDTAKTLAPGESVLSYATYHITAQDIIAGRIVNTAYAIALPVSDGADAVASKRLTSNESSAEVKMDRVAATVAGTGDSGTALPIIAVILASLTSISAFAIRRRKR